MNVDKEHDMKGLTLRVLLLAAIVSWPPHSACAAQSGAPGSSQTGAYASGDHATNRYSRAAIDTRRNWFYQQQAKYASTPGFDPRRPGYSDRGTTDRPGRNPLYNRKYDHEARLRALGDDPKVASADRGWIHQEIRRVDLNRSRPRYLRSGSDTLRNPPGTDLAHAHGQENHKGYGFHYAQIQNSDLHRLQHTGYLDHTWQYERDHDNPAVGGDWWGQRNRERVPPEYRPGAPAAMNPVTRFAN